MENNQTIVSNGNGDTWGEKRSEGRNGGKEGMAEWVQPCYAAVLIFQSASWE